MNEEDEVNLNSMAEIHMYKFYLKDLDQLIAVKISMPVAENATPNEAMKYFNEVVMSVDIKKMVDKQCLVS